MKVMGIVRKIDELGRVVIPMALRRSMGITEGTPVEVFASKDEITLRKYRPGCFFCNHVGDDLLEVQGMMLCRGCGTKILAAMGGEPVSGEEDENDQ